MDNPPSLPGPTHTLPDGTLIEVPGELLLELDQIDVTVDCVAIVDQETADLVRQAGVNALKFWQLFDAERKKHKALWQDAADSVDEFVRPWLKRMKVSQDRAKSKLTAYLEAEKTKAREAEIARLTAEDAASRALIPEGRTIAPLLPAIPAKAAPVIPTRKVPEILVTDEALIPRKYLTLNMPLIRKDTLDGEVIPGVSFKYVDQVISR